MLSASSKSPPNKSSELSQSSNGPEGGYPIWHYHLYIISSGFSGVEHYSVSLARAVRFSLGG